MKFLTAACLLVVCVFVNINGDEDTSPNDDMTEIVIPVTPSNAKIKIGRGAANTRFSENKGLIEVSGKDGFSPADTVTIQLHSLEVLGKRQKRPNENDDDEDDDEDYKELMGGRNKFESFDRQDFKLVEVVKDDVYPGTNINVTSLSSTVELKKKKNMTEFVVGRVNLTIYIFNEAASLNNSGEIFNVSVDSVKFNLAADSFQFCSNETELIGCDNETATAFEVVFAVRGKGGKAAKRAKNRPGEMLRIFSLGSRGAIRFSNKVEIDGVAMDIEEGFPKSEEKAMMTLITIRFKKFQHSLLYDPIIDTNLDGVVLEEDDDDDGPDNEVKDDGNDASTSRVSLFLGFCLLIFKIFS